MNIFVSIAQRTIVPGSAIIVLGSLAEYTARVARYISSNIPLEKWYLAVVGHNAIRISPVARRRRRRGGEEEEEEEEEDSCERRSREFNDIPDYAGTWREKRGRGGVGWIAREGGWKVGGRTKRGGEEGR